MRKALLKPHESHFESSVLVGQQRLPESRVCFSLVICGRFLKFGRNFNRAGSWASNWSSTTRRRFGNAFRSRALPRFFTKDGGQADPHRLTHDLVATGRRAGLEVCDRTEMARASAGAASPSASSPPRSSGMLSSVGKIAMPGCSFSVAEGVGLAS